MEQLEFNLDQEKDNGPTFPGKAYLLCEFSKDKAGFTIEIANQLLNAYVFPFVAKNDKMNEIILRAQAEGELRGNTITKD